ncbi:hypothetical protein [Dokdonia sp. PRO95]|uniref:hypothetical protein n=1 Tax=Dokdonia sp. PRO95 TaxID=1239415 RepID=UPI0005528CEF|nr:hypothetical protein [Dokdonia sp. PRO95]
MRITTSIIFFIILSCSNNKNDFKKYNALEQQAMLKFKDEAYEDALLNFEKAIALKPTKNVSIYFYAAAAALHLKRNQRAKELLIESIHNTNASEQYFLNFNEFNRFRNETLFTEIESDYDNHISKFYNNLEHPEIYREVDSLVAVDQEFRNNNSDWKEISRIDSLNVNRLIEITKDYGWQQKGWLILWHQRGTFGKDNYVWNFFKPYFDEQIAKGTIKKSFWTMFEEEQSLMKNKQQIYGLYTSQFDQFPIRDIKNVDKRRIENGLPPLWYMEKVYGIQLPSEYKEIAQVKN